MATFSGGIKGHKCLPAAFPKTLSIPPPFQHYVLWNVRHTWTYHGPNLKLHFQLAGFYFHWISIQFAYVSNYNHDSWFWNISRFTLCYTKLYRYTLLIDSLCWWQGGGGQTHSYGGQFSKRFCLIFHFFSLKPSRDQDEDNDICYSPIGSAVFELLSNTQTFRQTDILLL